MESLPPYSTNVRWKDYEIATPTFSLTPVEKPDMSPFLIHMTGKAEIQSILEGNGADEALPDGKGFLKASIPEQSRGNYSAEVVCFTESPTFALDFFRYRSFPRWQRDFRFGIGFSKTKLTDAGARPALYADNDLVAKIVGLHERRKQEEGEDLEEAEILKRLYPLCTPLLEHAQQEGFLWEREWRYAGGNGLVFDHEDIRVICCPDEERVGIQQVLGRHAEKIQFVRSWKEFSDVTDYLARQQLVWDHEARQQAPTRTIDDEIALVERTVQHLSISFHSLEEYEANLQRAESELARVREEMETRKTQLEMEQAKLHDLKASRQNRGPGKD